MGINIYFITLHTEQDIGEQWNMNSIPKLCILAFRNGCVFLVTVDGTQFFLEQFHI